LIYVVIVKKQIIVGEFDHCAATERTHAGEGIWFPVASCQRDSLSIDPQSAETKSGTPRAAIANLIGMIVDITESDKSSFVLNAVHAQRGRNYRSWASRSAHFRLIDLPSDRIVTRI
jgi:hypothetical protein